MARPVRRASVEALVDEQLSALDGLMAELRLGFRNQRHFDDLEEQAHDICRGLHAAFRNGAR